MTKTVLPRKTILPRSISVHYNSSRRRSSSVPATDSAFQQRLSPAPDGDRMDVVINI